MTAVRAFHPLDLFKFNLTNLDPLTETYDSTFYLSYLAKWPSLFSVAEGARGEVQAYRQSFPFSFSVCACFSLCVSFPRTINPFSHLPPSTDLRVY